MCLAIPAKVTEMGEGGLATVDILGVTREISVDLTPSAQVGSYVLVHAGFVVDEQFAQETIDLIRQFPELVADDLSAADVAVPTAAAAPGATATASVWAALAED